MVVSRHRANPSVQGGFTLIELMTVMVILGVLSVVAIVAYGRHVRNAHKTEVVSDLSNLVLRQKTWFATSGHYASSTDCEGAACTYPLASDLTTAQSSLAWAIADAGYTASAAVDGPYFRGGADVHGFDALRFMPEGGDSWCGYATISGFGATSSSGADVPAAGTLADQIFPAGNADPYIARDWFFAYALCDFDFDSTYWAFSTAHYTSDVNWSSDNSGTYLENE